MNLDPIERRLGRQVTDDEAAAFAAVKPVLGMLVGGRDYGIGWIREDTDERNANWYGFAVLTGARITTCYAVTPEIAADTLAELLLNRVGCPHCGRRISPENPEPGHCLWQRVGPRWRGSCITSPQPSTRTRKDSAS